MSATTHSPDTENRRFQIKGTLLARDLSVAGIARKIRRSRTAVSLAINRGWYPRTLQLVLEELGL